MDTPRKNGAFKGRFGVIMDSVFRPRTGFYGRVQTLPVQKHDVNT